MRFDTIQDFLNKFAFCPFCQKEVTKKLWHKFANKSEAVGYSFTDDNLIFSIGKTDKEVLTISLKDNTISSTAGFTKELMPSLFGSAIMKISLSCENISCQLKSCFFHVNSFPLYYDMKGVKIFYPLLERCSVTVPLEKGHAKYEHNFSFHRTRLTIFNYKTQADNLQANKFYPINEWGVVNNQIAYQQRQEISFFKDIPLMNIEQQDKESLINKAKMLVTFS